MDYEKEYKEALGRARTFSQRWQGIEATDSELALQEVKEIFPELKESEDEEIRKTLKSFFDSEISDYGNVEWRNGIRYGEIVSWLEKQGEQKADKCEGCNNIKGCVTCTDGDQYAHITEQKTQGKRALEVWKDMRLEVYQQASGNRHEPNYSDDNTKMFSLTDIDEIFEKVAEKQCEQKTTNKIKPRFKIGDTIRPKGSMAEYTIESIYGECYHGKGWGLTIGCDEDYELVEQKPTDKVKPKFHEGEWITIKE